MVPGTWEVEALGLVVDLDLALSHARGGLSW